jgi:hypothetical protein
LLEPAGKGGEIGTGTETQADRDRRQGQDGPVQEKARHGTAVIARAPDPVEGLLDAAQHQDCRDQQHGDAETREVPGLPREVLQVLLQAGRRFRYQVLEEQVLDAALDTLESGHGRCNREKNGKQRHEGKQRDVGERRCRVATVVVAVTPDQVDQAVTQGLDRRRRQDIHGLSIAERMRPSHMPDPRDAGQDPLLIRGAGARSALCYSRAAPAGQGLRRHGFVAARGAGGMRPAVGVVAYTFHLRLRLLTAGAVAAREHP